ncbi:MAG TPA: carboxypeptidase-like regulatory domain-containing protein, partial [Flavitalea sp.]|nr:carboxypeptidase-like regulatory domain-containing protein [Flavitalea sp.]
MLSPALKKRDSRPMIAIQATCSNIFSAKTIVVMKMTAILLLAFCFRVTANGYAQEVSLSEKNAPLEKIFKEIRKQTGFFFLYTDEMLQEASPVSISVKNLPLSVVLDKIFSNQPLQYTLVDNTVIVKRKKEVPVPNIRATPPPIIKGVIRDANGTPLAGATVTVKGSTKVTQTNAQGEFTLDVPDKAVLVISFVGFEQQEISVGDRTDIAIQLTASTSQLKDIVVVGYGTQKRANLTGAVDQVGTEAFENRSLA